MEIKGGGASSENRLIYYSNNYMSITELNNNQEIITKLEKDIFSNKYWFDYIPLVRGIINYFIQEYVKGKEITIDMRIIFVPMVYLIDKIFLHVGLMNYIYIGFLLFISFYITKNNNMKELHGAEHMCTTYYNKNKAISINEIDDIRKVSRFHKQCSTTSFIKNIIIFLILSFFIQDFFIKFFIMTSIEYEIFKYQDVKVLKILLYPITKLSEFMQLNIFTKEPKDIHLRMAIDAIQKLESVEKD